MEGDKGTVCVTGGTGYVASWLIMKLLQHGYAVRATVRSDPECKKDISYLTNLPKASEKLKIFNADLNQPDSFNAAIDGCLGVFHVAHPMDTDGKETEEMVTKRAVDGLLGILKASLNSKTVKRVVYTSSAVTMLFNDNGLSVMDESSWSDLEICRSNKFASTSYLVSKTVTERAALEFAERHGLDLVTVILPLVVGPFICPIIPSSVYITLSLILGNRDQYKRLLYSYTMVHIDDAACAHIYLLEYPNAKGRYICSSAETTIHTMYEYLSTKYPEFQLPSAERIKEIKSYERSSLSSVKLLDSGFKYKYGLDETIDGAIQSCKEKGFL